MRLLITDVTELRDSYCVAGWCEEEGRMIRPLPNGEHWPVALLDGHQVRPGSTISLDPTGREHVSSYPHRSEDLDIDPASIENEGLQTLDWTGPSAPPVATSVATAFGRLLQNRGRWNHALKGVHDLHGAKTVSLAAVRVAVEQLALYADNYNGKESLRGYLRDDEECYSLPVVARSLREAFRDGGVDRARGLLPRDGNIHVRLGLARAWDDQPDMCSLMINGIYG